MRSALPDVGDPLVIRDWDGRTYRSRVEDLSEQVITVALPSDLMVTDPYGEGDQLLVTWAAPAGVIVLPSELVGSRTERSIRLWDLMPTGEPWTEQRRAHVRVPVSGAVTVTPEPADENTVPPHENTVPADGAEPDTGGPLAGRLVDISEAALQCSADALLDDARLQPGARVLSTFSLRGEEFRLPGIIHSCRAGERVGQVRLVVLFQHSERDADALRKQVFAAQLDLRRAQR